MSRELQNNNGVDIALFRPVTVTQPRVPIRDMDKVAYLKITKELIVKEKVKEIRQ